MGTGHILAPVPKYMDCNFGDRSHFSTGAKIRALWTLWTARFSHPCVNTCTLDLVDGRLMLAQFSMAGLLGNVRTVEIRTICEGRPSWDRAYG